MPQMGPGGSGDYRPALMEGGGRASRSGWAPGYVASALLLDGLAFGIAACGALLVRFGHLHGRSPQVVGPGLRFSYVLAAAGLLPVWLVALASAGVYDHRVLGAGNEEYRRLVNGAVRALAALGVLTLGLHADLARLVVLVMLPAALGLSAGGKHLLRNALLAGRLRGHYLQSVVVVGFEASIGPLVRHLSENLAAGYRVTAAFTGLDTWLGDPIRSGRDEDDPPLDLVKGGRQGLLELVTEGGPGAIAVVNSGPLGPGGLRQLGWDLEGHNVEILVGPEATDVAGPRIRVFPVNGLALLHVEEPHLSGSARLVKEVIERASAVLLLFLISPFLLAVSAAIRLTSPGPALFRQERVGKDGRVFVLWKFRTMVSNAAEQRAEIEAMNESDGPLFKIRRDPRMTAVGRHLRRWSIDELPQLWNVVRGDMSVVGPRPPMPAEVERYATHVLRRLMVKPGLTGLWQVSGRSDLSWEESVRLDLQYVDNWSLTQDLVIVARTIKAVLLGTGAY